LLSDSSNSIVIRAVVLTQYRRVTDRQTCGQTDGIAIASTALAMRTLRRSVKTLHAFGKFELALPFQSHCHKKQSINSSANINMRFEILSG